MMARPRLMLLDEPSLGLAPLMVERIMAQIVALRAAGGTILVVEQNARAALGIADRGYVLENGRVTLGGRGRGTAAQARRCRTPISAAGRQRRARSSASAPSAARSWDAEVFCLSRFRTANR